MNPREQWRYRMGYYGLDFADAEQVYPKPRHKNAGGTVPPFTTTDRKNNQEKTTIMESTTESSSTNNTHDFKNLSSEEMAKLMKELNEEFRKSRSLSTRAINATVIAAGVAVGFGIVVAVARATSTAQATPGV